MTNRGRRIRLVAVTIAILSTFGVAAWLVNRGQAPRMIDSGIPPKPLTGVFRDVAESAGIDFRMAFLPGEQGATFKINLYDHGSGLAIGDCDGDGDDDIYFLNQLGPNGLFRNNGDGKFTNITAPMNLALDDRVCVGATFNDYDNDGDQDLYVTSTRGGNVLFRNENNQAFRDVTKEMGLEHIGHSQTAAFFDYNKDGLLDLFLVQTAEWTTGTLDDTQRYFVGKGENGLQSVIESPREFNVLYRNDGERFVNVTEQANMQGRGWSGDVAVYDYDDDGWLDVLVPSMFGRAQLYRNQHDGTFVDVGQQVLKKTPIGGIGAKVFDFNNDGKLDIYIVDMHSDMWMGLDYGHDSLNVALESEKTRFPYFYGPQVETSNEFRQMETALAENLGFRHDEALFGNAFYKCVGNGQYEEISADNNLETFWPWGIAAGDFDNDGFKDVFVTSGMGYPFYYWRNYLMMNDGDGGFSERSTALGVEPPEGGEFLQETIGDTRCARSSRCVATADFDNDGRLEIVTNNFNSAPYFFKNQLSQRNYIAFRLRGTRSNRDAIGALVRISTGDQIQLRQVNPAGGYLSQSSKTIHFGLGDKPAVDQVEILWPSGQRQVLQHPEPNRRHDIVEPDEDETDKSFTPAPK